MKDVQLKVMEALQEEAYKGIVRIDSSTMRDIGVRVGDIVEIEGTRVTVGIVDRAYPTDIGQTVIRMDGILRRNAKTSIGEIVKVRKAEVKEAQSITIAPAQKGVTVRVDPNMFKRGLLGRSIVKGDLLALGGTKRRKTAMSENPFFDDVFQMFEDDFLGGFGVRGLRFVVADCHPKGAVIISENTQLKVSSKAMEIQEDKISLVTYEDIGGLNEEVTKVREMIELPLKHPEV
ncbi:ATPase, partial [archaeon]|nr:ATPase [archaeon]